MSINGLLIDIDWAMNYAHLDSEIVPGSLVVDTGKNPSRRVQRINETLRIAERLLMVAAFDEISFSTLTQNPRNHGVLEGIYRIRQQFGQEIYEDAAGKVISVFARNAANIIIARERETVLSLYQRMMNEIGEDPEGELTEQAFMNGIAETAVQWEVGLRRKKFLSAIEKICDPKK